MEDGSSGGITLTGLTIGGAALTALGGIVGAWYRTRFGRTTICPSPLEVRGIPGLVTEKVCDDERRGNRDAHANIFARLSAHDREISALQAQAIETRDRLVSMDSKLDILIKRRG